MMIKRQLSQASLASVLRTIEQSYQTGLLTVRSQTSDSAQTSQEYYIWFVRGCIVAVDKSLDGKGFISKIVQRNWLSQEALNKLVDRCPADMPLGMFLKAEGVLKSEQLKLLFYVQVLQPVCGVFKLKNGQIEFDSMASVPNHSMTGLSLLATRAALMGLRMVRNWDSLSAKLPEATSVLNRTVESKPNFKLDILEREVWELACGKLSLEAIAEELNLLVEKVQQVAFRLIMAGLAEEVFPVKSAF